MSDIEKVLFLDVDGVLNGGQTREKCNGFTGVEQSMCERVRRILTETNCSIVLCSTWRKHDDMLPYLWGNLGADALARHIGNTPSIWNQPRGAEIATWLAENPTVKRFVILGDDADMAHLLSHLVKTDNRIGITDEIANEVIKRFTDPSPNKV